MRHSGAGSQPLTAQVLAIPRVAGRLRRVSLIAAGAVVVVGACQLLLPQRFAVNAPLRQLLLGRGIAAPSIETVEARLHAPSGFSVGRYAEGIPGSRLLRFTPTGDLLVSVPREGKIVLLEPTPGGVGGRGPHARSSQA